MRKAPAKAPTDCLNAGWGPSAWGRVIGQQIDNRYRAFADPRASGQLLGFQSGIDLWRGEWLPGHRDAAGIYFRLRQCQCRRDRARHQRGGDQLCAAQDRRPQSRRLVGRGLLDALRPGRLVPRRGGAGDALSRLGVHAIRRACDHRLRLRLVAGDGLSDPSADVWTGLRAGAAGADRLATCVVRRRQ